MNDTIIFYNVKIKVQYLEICMGGAYYAFAERFDNVNIGEFFAFIRKVESEIMFGLDREISDIML